MKKMIVAALGAMVMVTGLNADVGTCEFVEIITDNPKKEMQVKRKMATSIVKFDLQHKFKFDRHYTTFSLRVSSKETGRVLSIVDYQEHSSTIEKINGKNIIMNHYIDHIDGTIFTFFGSKAVTHDDRYKDHVKARVKLPFGDGDIYFKCK